jgi:hypothetical protein
LRRTDLDQFRSLVDAGHEIGSHAHRLTYDAATDTWQARIDELNRWGRPNYSAALASQAWSDADRWVTEALTETGISGENTTMCAVPFLASDEGDLMASGGYTVAAGNRSEIGEKYFHHTVWNPWRASASDEIGHEIEHGDATYLSIDHLAQIGRAEAHGTDLTIPQMQRRFLTLYVEWLARERTGTEDRIWTFGFVYHPNYGDEQNEALIEFLDWLDAGFIGQSSPHGNTIARYATARDVAAAFADWERSHAGAVSFSYRQGDPYPYSHPGVTEALDGAAYQGPVDLGPGVSCHAFNRQGDPVYLIWADSAREVDASAAMAGAIVVVDPDGTRTEGRAAALHVGPEPLVVEIAG